MSDTQDRRRGALVGLAVGDAFGAAIEFRSPGTFAPVTCYRDGGPFSLAAGQWTDDTSLALALADSIKESGWNLTDQLQKYVEWWETGKYSVNGHCFDIGNTTRWALDQFNRTKQTVANDDEASSGNGSIMRLAPVPIAFYDKPPKEIANYADQSSYTTHGSPQCRSACEYMGVVLAALMNGEDRDKVLSPDWEVLKEIAPLHPLVQQVANGSFRTRKPPQIKGSGWVIGCLEAALWAFHDAPDFETAVLKAVNLGDDADTTGVVCGQFAGAYWGESGIPAELRNGLDKFGMIDEALKGIMQ